MVARTMMGERMLGRMCSSRMRGVPALMPCNAAMNNALRNRCVSAWTMRVK
jgi:hypothetical protein